MIKRLVRTRTRAGAHYCILYGTPAVQQPQMIMCVWGLRVRAIVCCCCGEHDAAAAANHMCGRSGCRYRYRRWTVVVATPRQTVRSCGSRSVSYARTRARTLKNIRRDHRGTAPSLSPCAIAIAMCVLKARIFNAYFHSLDGGGGVGGVGNGSGGQRCNTSSSPPDSGRTHAHVTITPCIFIVACVCVCVRPSCDTETRTRTAYIANCISRDINICANK